MASVGDLPYLAERLGQIMEIRRTPTGEPFTNKTLAAELGRKGIHVTDAHIAHMRAGRRRNPSAKLLHGIADVLDVPISYFIDDNNEFNEQLTLLLMLRDSRVKSLLFRAHGVSTAGLEEAIRTVNSIRAKEGLDKQGGDHAPTP